MKTDSRGRKPCEDSGRDGGVQLQAKHCRPPAEAGRGKERFQPEFSRELSPADTFDFGLLAFRTVRE